MERQLGNLLTRQFEEKQKLQQKQQNKEQKVILILHLKELYEIVEMIVHEVRISKSKTIIQHLCEV